MRKTRFCALLIATMLLLPNTLLAHDPVPPTPADSAISAHSVNDPDIYFGFGPPWGTSFAAWNQARSSAFAACLSDGNPVCNYSVAAWDHCTFWGEGEFVHGAPRGEPGFTTPRYICISHPPAVADADGDGVNDDVDVCANTNLDATISIAGMDSGVENTFFSESGCSTSDLVNEIVDDCSVDVNNHGQVVSCFARGANALKQSGVLTGAEKGALQSLVAGSPAGKSEKPGKSK